MKLSFSELLTEGMGEAIEFYMTDDTAPPKQYYGAFELNGEQYGMSFVQTTTARHFTFEFYRIANKNKKYWDIRKGGDWNVVVPTIMRFIEMVYTMSKSQCDSIIIRVPDTPKLAARQKFLERIIRKSFVKTMTYVPVQRLTEQKFTHIYLVKKGVDPKSIFNGAVFKKHFTFDIKDTPIAELATDENLAALTDPYKYQKPKPSLRPSKLALGVYSLDTDTANIGDIGSEIDTVTGAIIDKDNFVVHDTLDIIKSHDGKGNPYAKIASANTDPEEESASQSVGSEIPKTILKKKVSGETKSIVESFKNLPLDVKVLVGEYLTVLITAFSNAEFSLLEIPTSVGDVSQTISAGRMMYGNVVLSGVYDTIKEKGYYYDLSIVKLATAGSKFRQVDANDHIEALKPFFNEQGGREFFEKFIHHMNLGYTTVNISGYKKMGYLDSKSPPHGSMLSFSEMIACADIEGLEGVLKKVVPGERKLYLSVYLDSVYNKIVSAVKNDPIANNILRNVGKRVAGSSGFKGFSSVAEWNGDYATSMAMSGELDDVDKYISKLKTRVAPIFGIDPISAINATDENVPKTALAVQDIENQEFAVGGNAKPSFFEHVDVVTEKERQSLAAIMIAVIATKISGYEVPQFKTGQEAIDWANSQTQHFDYHVYAAILWAYLRNGYLANNSLMAAIFKGAEATPSWYFMSPSGVQGILDDTNLLGLINDFSTDGGFKKGSIDYLKISELVAKYPFYDKKGSMVALFLRNTDFIYGLEQEDKDEIADYATMLALYNKFSTDKVNLYFDNLKTYDVVASAFWGLCFDTLMGKDSGVPMANPQKVLYECVQYFFSQEKAINLYMSDPAGKYNMIKNLVKVPKFLYMDGRMYTDHNSSVKSNNTAADLGDVYVEETNLLAYKPEEVLNMLFKDGLDKEQPEAANAIFGTMLLGMILDRLGFRSKLDSMGKIGGSGKSEIDSFLKVKHSQDYIWAALNYIGVIVPGNYSKMLAKVGAKGNTGSLLISEYNDAIEAVPHMTWVDLRNFAHKYIAKANTDSTSDPKYWITSDPIAPNNKVMATIISGVVVLAAMPMFLTYAKNGINMQKLKDDQSTLAARISTAISNLNNDPFMSEFVAITTKEHFQQSTMPGNLTLGFLTFLESIVNSSSPEQHVAIIEGLTTEAKKMIFGSNYPNMKKGLSDKTANPFTGDEVKADKPKFMASSAKTADVALKLKVSADNPFSVDNDNSAVYGTLGFVPNKSDAAINSDTESKRNFLSAYPQVYKSRMHLKTHSGKPGSYMYSYTGSSYSDYNGNLREMRDSYKNVEKIKNGERLTVDPHMIPVIEDFDALAVSIDKPFWVYRNTSIPNAPSYQVGDDLIDFGFMSTSINPNMSLGSGSGENSSRLKIFIPAGTLFVPAYGVGSHPSEDEIILPPLAINRIVEKVVVENRKPGKNCFTCVYSGTAYKSAFDYGQKTIKEQLELAETVSLSQIRSLIEAKVKQKANASNDIFGPALDVGRDDKWGTYGEGSKETAEWLRKLEAKKKK